MTHAAHGHASHPTADAEARLDPAANWLWFAPAIGHTSALVIGDISPSYLRGLSPHFERIERIPVASLYRAVVRSDPRAPGSIRFVFGEASMDFVIATDLVSGWSDSGRSPFRDPRFVAALTDIRRLLRPGGVLFLSGHNARWHRRLLRRQGPGLRLGEAKRALMRAGFAETRAYFVEPSVGDVAAVVPACRQAAVAYERERAPRHGVPWRALWAAGALYESLYPDAFVLAIT